MPSLSSSPWILGAPHSGFSILIPDQVAHLLANPWPAAARTGFPPPKCRISQAMPTDNRLGPDDGYGVKDAREAPIEPNEQNTVGPTQMHSAWGALLQHIELLPQNKDFGF